MSHSVEVYNEKGQIVQSSLTGGTVTAVYLTAPDIFDVTGSPVTASGTLALTLATQTANTVFAGPAGGGPDVPTFRALVAADIPSGSGSPLTSKGDLYTHTGTVNTRLPVGTNGLFLAADSTQTTGLKWVDGYYRAIPAFYIGVDGTDNTQLLHSGTGFTITPPTGLPLTIVADTNVAGTGYLKMAVGTTLQRPGTPSNGMFRYNTDTVNFEAYAGGSWINFSTSITSIALTGDISGSGTSPITTTLATVNSDVGTYALATVTANAKGLVTAVSAASTTGSGSVVLATSPTITSPSISGALTITGTADVAQLKVISYSGQTSTNPPIQLIGIDGVTQEFLVTADGRISLAGGSGGAVFSDVYSVFQTGTSNVGLAGDATARVLHRFSIVRTISGANLTGTLTNASYNMTVDPGTFTVSLLQANNAIISVPNTATTGTLTTSASYTAQGVNNAAGVTMATYIGFRMQQPTVTGAITSGIAFLAASLSGTASNSAYFQGGTTTVQTGRWGVIITDTAANSAFAAPVSIGKATTPNTSLDAVTADSGTNTIVNIATITHNSSGTPAAGFGTGLLVNGKSSTTADTNMGRVYYKWATATHASRKAQSDWSVYDTSERVVVSIGTDGSQGLFGLFGVTPVARPTAYTQTYSTAARTNPNMTAVSVATTAATNTTPYGYTTAAQADAIVSNLNAVIVDVTDLKKLVNSIIDDLQAYGAFQ